MKTPCQKLGYKVGDKFEILRGNSDGFSVGTIVSLFKDDGTTMPLFAGENTKFRNACGEAGAYTHLHNVKPIKPKKAKRPWIKWEGGECPVPKGTLIDVKYRDGHKQKGCPAGPTPGEFERNASFWGNAGAPSDIIAYRLAKPKEAAAPAPEVQAEPTVQREANGRPVGAKVGDWFKVIEASNIRPYRVGDKVQFTDDDGTDCPYFLLNGYRTCIHWGRLEPCPAPSQPEPEPAKPEWEILWGSAADFEGAPDWAIYAVGTRIKYWVQDVTLGAMLMRYDTEERELGTVQGVANHRPYAARRLKQPK